LEIWSPKGSRSVAAPAKAAWGPSFKPSTGRRARSWLAGESLDRRLAREGLKVAESVVLVRILASALSAALDALGDVVGSAEARLHSLAPEDRRTLRAASTFGRARA
jgi:hypothetical protein